LKEHKKHASLIKPNIGFYSSNEWAIYGTTCENIDRLFDKISTLFKGKEERVVIVDADHNLKDQNFSLRSRELCLSFNFAKDLNEYDKKSMAHPSDIVLINGNHYPGKQQIIILDSEKEASLLRRKNQLDNIKLILTTKKLKEPFPWLKELIDEEVTKVLSLEDTELISDFILNEKINNVPPLKALILAGGKSMRMGTDKSQLNIHGVTQEIYLANICKDLGLEAFISKRKSHDNNIASFEVIEDRFLELGPFGAICSALLKDPNSAWLVLACDLPYLDKATIQLLVDNRNSDKIATALKAASKDFPEPLITIYEPGAYGRLLQFLSLGFSCPRKVLINSDIEIIELKNDSIFTNVNYPEDLKKIKL
jgi:molybdopterin-guanine dinucleotide biosynthesis protein A